MTQINQQRRRRTDAARRPSGALPSTIGPWKLVELAGEGSLGLVYRARPETADPHRPATYALKLLRPEWQDEPLAIRVLAREALVGRQAPHPNLVPILASSVGHPPRYLVMPWLEGATLDKRLHDPAQLGLSELLWITRQVTAGLDALHRRGWTHGDVKPGNVMISPRGHATLIDAGFAERGGEITAAVDRPVMGTCAYMAPELLASRLRADIRSDLYSLGVMMFEAIAGRLPFLGSTPAELATAHRTAAPPRLRRIAPHTPRALSELIHRLLAKDPLRRPATPAELRDWLIRLEIATFGSDAVA